MDDSNRRLAPLIDLLHCTTGPIYLRSWIATELIRMVRSNLTFANLQRVKQVLCDWDDWHINLDKLATLADSPANAALAAGKDPQTGLVAASIKADKMLLPPQHGEHMQLRHVAVQSCNRGNLTAPLAVLI